ncbi:MAG: Xaa-Pro peptidase family protein [Verrucomicrobiales bacterium]
MPGSPPPLNPTSCRARQEKLRHYLAANELDGAIFFNRHYIYSLSGYWHAQPLTPVSLLVKRDGEVTLVTHDESPDAPAADQVKHYVPNHLCTLKPNLSACVTEVLSPLLSGLKVVGTDEQTPAALISGPACRDITEDYQYLRRHKDADEVAALEFTITCADKTYAEAKQLLEPGIGEVEVMAAMLEVATYAAGEFLSGWGQDFQAGSPGGFARPRREVIAGELMPLDIGVGVRGYRCDLCRTFAVDGQPTDEQATAHARVLEVMKLGETFLKPGQSCREMFDVVHRELDGWQGYQFFHHAGHGIGLDAHEVPRINSGWDDTFEIGDVVAFEPGLYGGNLRAGIRLENNYLITAEGHRQLSHFPLDLV